MKPFAAPQKSLGGIDTETTAALLAAASDISLVIDNSGVVRDLAISNDQLMLADAKDWIGQPWISTVTSESRPKIEMLLREASSEGERKWRQVNHPSNDGADTPIVYSTVQLEPKGKIIAFGRDLRRIALLQQRLLQAQYAIERDYARLRHLETRYRLLFNVAEEAVLIVDANSRRIIDANPAASSLLSKSSQRLVGTTFPRDFDKAGNDAIRRFMELLQETGSTQPISVNSPLGKEKISLSGSVFRQDNESLFLLRLAREKAKGNGNAPESAIHSRLMSVIEQSSDAFVITDSLGSIKAGNSAFLEFTQTATLSQVVGQSLARWLGRPGVDLDIALASLRDKGVLRLFRTTISGELGSEREVELSAVFVPDGENSCIGFVIRDVGQRFMEEPAEEPAITHSPGELTNLVGRVPLKQIVQETVEVIERLCIETALDLSGNNRASAAEMLGVSRQGLYKKLHRHGISEPGGED
ncbi:transcriptional regulator PpsR [Limibacillus halophilus]